MQLLLFKSKREQGSSSSSLRAKLDINSNIQSRK